MDVFHQSEKKIIHNNSGTFPPFTCWTICRNINMYFHFESRLRTKMHSNAQRVIVDIYISVALCLQYVWCAFAMRLLKSLVSLQLCEKLLSVALQSQQICFTHYGDVIMGTRPSQITSLTIVYSTVYSDADQRKHQRSASLAFVRGIYRWPVNSPHKGLVTPKMFPFDDVIMKDVCFKIILN